MTTETPGSSMPDAVVPTGTTYEPAVGNSPDVESLDVQVASPEFQEMSPHGKHQNGKTDLNRFQDIKVTVSADLGRAQVPLQTLMNLGEGSVLELNREIDSPVELVAQGVALACGEVVVVNGCFAVRVTKVYEGKQGIKDVQDRSNAKNLSLCLLIAIVGPLGGLPALACANRQSITNRSADQ